MEFGTKRSGRRRLALLEGKVAGSLLVHEIFRSLQGESSFAGLPCVFIRLATCDARCRWCDTAHAFDDGVAKTVDEVVAEVSELGAALVQVTGGEPMLQREVLQLMATLADGGSRVLLETSGAHDLSEVDERVHIVMDLKCPDSGEQARNRWENLTVLKPSDEIKLVVASRGDFDWAVAVTTEHQLDERFQVLVSPVHDAIEPLDLANWLLDSGIQARLQLQLHKLLWGPNVRGV